MFRFGHGVSRSGYSGKGNLRWLDRFAGRCRDNGFGVSEQVDVGPFAIDRDESFATACGEYYAGIFLLVDVVLRSIGVEFDGLLRAGTSRTLDGGECHIEYFPIVGELNTG